MSDPDDRLVAVDGRDALYYLIVRPGPDTEPGIRNGSSVLLEQAANGITEAQAAHILRAVANQLDPDTAQGK